MNRHLRSALTITLSTFAVVSSASAQVALAPGSTVQVTTTALSHGIEGTLISRSPDTLVVAMKGGSLVRIAQQGVTGIQIQSGKRRLGPALKWGAIGGAIWGAVVATMPYRECDPKRYTNCDRAITRGEFIASQTIGMALITGTIGAIRGGPAWTPIEGTVTTVGGLGGSPNVGVRLALRF